MYQRLGPLVLLTFMVAACGDDRSTPDAGTGPSCDGVDCGEHAACEVVGDTPVCGCEVGFHMGAAACEVDQVCDATSCTSDTAGTCTDTGGIVSCTCNTGYAGTTCEMCGSGFHRDNTSACVADGPAPLITALTPNTGPTAGGTTVTIKGQNFVATDLMSITFAGAQVAAAQIQVVDPQTITVKSPASPVGPGGGPRTGPVDVVITGNGTQAMAHNAFHYGPALSPAAFSVEPAQGDTVASAGTVLAAPFFAAQPAGAVVVQATRALAYFSLDGVSTDVSVVTGRTSLVDAAVADINGDGRLDVVLLDQGAKQIVRATNSNNTSFTSGGTVSIIAAGTPLGMAIGLFNNDGFYDLAVTMQNPDQLVIFQGGAGGVFTEQPAIALPNGSFGTNTGQTQNIAVADPHRASTDPRQVRDVHDAGPQGLDMNGDGRTDLVIFFSELGLVAVYTQSPTTPLLFAQSSTADVTIAGSSGRRSLALGDFDGDGDLDGVVASGGAGGGTPSRLVTFNGNGAGMITTGELLDTPGVGNLVLRSIVVGDFNHDWRPDIVSASFNGSNITMYLGRGDGTFGNPSNYDAEIAAHRAGATIESLAADPTFTSIIALDSNGTANKNYVTRVAAPTHALVQGEPLTPSTLAAMTDPQAIAFGKLVDRDHHDDIVVANRTSGTIQVYVNDGADHFTAAAAVSTGMQPESIAIADVDGDGDNDVLVACSGSNAVYVHKNNGQGQLGAGTSVAVNASGPHQVVAVDMDQDGTVDFVTVNKGGNSVSCFVNPAGGGSFVPASNFAPVGQPAGVYPVGNAPAGVAVADFSGDKRLDIATANSGDDSVTILVRDSAVGVAIDATATIDLALGGTIQPAPSQPNGTLPITIAKVEPVSIAVADLNQDGFLDIITADKFTSTLTILHGGKNASGSQFYVPSDYGHFGTATAIGTPSVKLVTPASPSSLSVIDMSNDGRLDLVVGSAGSSSIASFINQGRKTQAAATGATDLDLTPPSTTVSAAGETAFVFDNALQLVQYETGSVVSYSASATQPVTAIATGFITGDPAPLVGATCSDGNIRLFGIR